MRWRELMKGGQSEGKSRQALPYLEAAGGILLLTFFFVYFYGRSSLLYPRFHPFLVIVLLVAGRYGFVPGLFAALIGSLDYYALLLWQNHWDSLMPGDFSFLWPSTFLFSGMILGEMRDSEKRRYEDLYGKYLKKKDSARSAELERDILAHAKKDLERRIFLDPNAVTDLFDVFRSLEKDESESISSSLVSLFTSFLGADSVALYKRSRREFVLELEAGDARVPRVVDRHYVPFSRAFDSKEGITLWTHGALSVLELPEGGKIRPVGVYPIRSSEDQVEFLLVVWHAPFEKLTTDFFQLAGMIVERASSRLTFLRTQRETQESVSFDEDTGFLRPVFFARRAAEELGKAFRYGTEISFLSVHFEVPQEEDRNNHQALMAFREVSRKILRSVDLVGLVSDRSGVAFCLPHTGEAGVLIVEGKLLDLWNECVAHSPLLENVLLRSRKITFFPDGGDASLRIHQHMMSALDRMFVFDPSTQTWGEHAFADHFWKELRESQRNMGLLRLTFSQSSWEEALTIRKSLSKRKNQFGKSLFPHDGRVGISLEGRHLWILLPDATEELLKEWGDALRALWNEADLPKLKRGELNIEEQILVPPNVEESPMLSDLRELLDKNEHLNPEEILLDENPLDLSGREESGKTWFIRLFRGAVNRKCQIPPQAGNEHGTLGRSNERHGTLPESSGDSVPVER